MKLMPSAKARSRQARAASASTPTPEVNQEPSENSGTPRSLAPSLRFFISVSSRHQHRRALNLSGAQKVQRFVGLGERKGPGLRLHPQLGGDCEEFGAVLAGEIGDREDRSLAPEIGIGKAW